MKERTVTTTEKPNYPKCKKPVEEEYNEWSYPCGVNTICIQYLERLVCKCKPGHYGDPNPNQGCHLAQPGELISVGGHLNILLFYDPVLHDKNSKLYESFAFEFIGFIEALFTSRKMDGYIYGSNRIISILYAFFFDSFFFFQSSLTEEIGKYIVQSII